jgi:hypothetical protein
MGERGANYERKNANGTISSASSPSVLVHGSVSTAELKRIDVAE